MGYHGVEKRVELNGAAIDPHIAEQYGKVRTLKKHPIKNKVAISIEYIKASIRAKVEHPFRILKCPFGFTKAGYRALDKEQQQVGNVVCSGEYFSYQSDASSVELIRQHA